MARVKKHPEERRAELVAAARRLFETKGVEETSVSDIVKAVGVAQGTFYWYFSSKDEILNVAVEHMADEVCDAILAVSKAAGVGALQKLTKMGEAFLSNFGAEGAFLEHFHYGEEHRQFHDYLVQEVVKRLMPVFTEVIEEGVAEGVFETGNPQAAASFILLASRAVHDEGILDPSEDSDKEVAALMDFALKGLGCKPRH